ncbi:MAG: hypothetical protein M1817_001332 [Caeruleum heppii]|nr:MAG: hypothetical protein M1817_001332 [Caeruleum heppii]
MLENLFTLLALSLVMAIASFLAGAAPLSLSLSPAKIRLISTVGMGVLMGTSLIVIIPEGIETLYSASDAGHAHGKRDVMDVRWNVQRDSKLMRREIEMEKRGDPAEDAFNALPGPVIPGSVTVPKAPRPTAGDFHTQKAPSASSSTQNEEAEEASSPHSYVGISLILGFILMYLIDHLPRHLLSSFTSSSSPHRPHQVSLENLSQGLYRTSSASSSAPPSPSHRFARGRGNAGMGLSRSLSTTLGLCIHAAADGIALGASSTSTGPSSPAPSSTTTASPPPSTRRLSIIIFLAIMVHKAPAAFGLTSILLKQGLSKRQTKAHLLIFSLAAPVGALLTWGLGTFFFAGSGGGDERGVREWTGCLLLFSGGTFLYVAMHTMQSAPSSPTSSSPSSSSSHSQSYPLTTSPYHANDPTKPSDHDDDAYAGNGYLNDGGVYGGGEGSGDAGGGAAEGKYDTLAAVVGMLIPLVTQVGHVH